MRTPGARTRVYQRKPRARDRIWQSMRILRSFTIPTLMATAEASETNVMRYVRGLLAASYLYVVKPRDSGRRGGHAVYRLIRDTGPIAPRLQRNGTTYDPNKHEVVTGGVDQRPKEARDD